MKNLLFIDNTKKWENKFEYHGSAFVSRTPNSLDRKCYKTQEEYNYAVKLQKQFIDMEILLWLYRPWTIILSNGDEFTFTFYTIKEKGERMVYFIYGEREEELLDRYQRERPGTFRPRLTIVDTRKLPDINKSDCDSNSA